MLKRFAIQEKREPNNIFPIPDLHLKDLLPVIRFLLLASGLYVFWYFFYETWLHPEGKLDAVVIENTITCGRSILRFFGYSVFTANRTIGIEGTGGAWIGDPCNGINLFALFSGFIICFPGKAFAKLIFIPIGILSIHFLNILRVVTLLLIQLYSPSSLNFNHTYTFTFIVYLYIFFLWMVWVKKSGISKKEIQIPEV